MKYKILIIICFVISSLFTPYALEAADYVPGEVLIKFKQGISQKAANAANRIVQATLIKKLSGPSEVLLVQLPSDVSVTDAVEEYMKDSNVIYAEPNYIRKLKATAAEYSLLWGIHNTGQLINNIAGLPDADMDVLPFWTSGTVGDATVIIAVIDSGANMTHEDITANLWTNPIDSTANGSDEDGNTYTDDINGWDFVNDDNDPSDDNGHGTHVSGTIAADGTNAIATSITGVMQTAKIMPLKSSDASGNLTTDDIVEAINYAVDRKRDLGDNVKAINMSFGGSFPSVTERDAISQAEQEGILVVAAAGNESTNNDSTPNYPSSYSVPTTIGGTGYPGLTNIIAVAATDQFDQLASFSNYGALSVHVAAPGVSTYSTHIGGTDQYTYMSGTSMATPHVAGVAGLLWAVNSGWTYTQVKNAIINNVDVRQCLTGLVSSDGRVNANQARTSAPDLATPTDFTSTAVSTEQIDLSWTDTGSEDGYNIYRKFCSAACSAYTLIYTLAADSTAQSDTGLSPGTCYSYIIRAFTTTGPPATERSDEAVITGTTQGGASVASSDTGNSGHARNCFIATAAYGSPMHPYVEALRGFRDRHLLTNYFGKKFVDYYYQFSPPLAEVIKESELLKAVTRVMLTPLVIFVVFPYTSFALVSLILVSSIIGIHMLRKHRFRV
jgi:subtilisin family serine protease